MNELQGAGGGGKVDPKTTMFRYCTEDMLRFACASLLFIFLVLRGIQLSRNLHKDIIWRLLKASFPKFYNLVMTGRLMNRLSKDIYNIDLVLTREFILFLSFLLQTLCCLLVYVLIR